MEYKIKIENLICGVWYKSDVCAYLIKKDLEYLINKYQITKEVRDMM